MFLSASQCRDADQAAIEIFGIPGIVLMENAGKRCADILLQRAPNYVTLFCGPGNNGGDGFVIARHLASAGVSTKIFLFGSPNRLSADSAANLDIVKRMNLDVTIVESFSIDHSHEWSEPGEDDWYVDALLGTGSSGPPREPFGQVIESINQSNAKVLAVDVPTGLDCDSGIPSERTLIADLTCTFVAQKTGFQNPAARSCLGDVQVVEIGIATSFLVSQADQI